MLALICDSSVVETEDVCLYSILCVCSGIHYPLVLIVKLQKNMHDFNVIFWGVFSHHLAYTEQMKILKGCLLLKYETKHLTSISQRHQIQSLRSFQSYKKPKT